MKRKRNTRGLGRVYPRGKNGILWLQYSANGKRIRESSNTTDRDAAMRKLKQRLHEAAEGKIIAASGVVFNGLAALLLNDYKVNSRSSTVRASIALENLRKFFGATKRAADITSAEITGYIAERLETVRPATINVELAMMRHAFKLAF